MTEDTNTNDKMVEQPQEDDISAREDHTSARSAQEEQFRQAHDSSEDLRMPGAVKPEPKPVRSLFSGLRPARKNSEKDGSASCTETPAAATCPGNLCPFLADGFPWSRKPWRKRHPYLFLLLLLAALLVAGAGISQYKKAVPLSLSPAFGIVRVEGVIMDASSIVNWIDELTSDSKILGVLVYIDSPGGAVAPSEEIYRAVKRLANKKPVVACMGSAAASGGYFVAVGAPDIVANASSLTASIGVRLEIPNAQELMKTVGLSVQTLTTGNLKDAGSVTRAMTPREEAYFMELLQNMHTIFVEAVAQGRDMPIEQVRALADGRAMTGKQALEAKLVDVLGDMHDAKDILMERCGLSPADKVDFISGPPENTQGLLKQLFGTMMQGILQQQAQQQPQFFF